MTEPPRGRPASQAPPPLGAGRNALTYLGGLVLVVAVAGGAWALFGRGGKNGTPTASKPTTISSPANSPGSSLYGPVAPASKATPVAVPATTPVAVPAATPVAVPKPTPTSTRPTSTPKPAAVGKPTARPSSTPAPVATTPPPAVTPSTGSPQAGTVAKKNYTFTVARGDTLWKLAADALRATGRTASNTNIANHLAQLYAHNAAVIGSNPNLILPGQTVVWPAGL